MFQEVVVYVHGVSPRGQTSHQSQWDKDDPIGWPVEPLMQQAGTVIGDRYVDVSDSPASAHTAYWESAAFRKKVAEHW